MTGSLVTWLIVFIFLGSVPSHLSPVQYSGPGSLPPILDSPTKVPSSPHFPNLNETNHGIVSNALYQRHHPYTVPENIQKLEFNGNCKYTSVLQLQREINTYIFQFSSSLVRISSLRLIVSYEIALVSNFFFIKYSIEKDLKSFITVVCHGKPFHRVINLNCECNVLFKELRSFVNFW